MVTRARLRRLTEARDRERLLGYAEEAAEAGTVNEVLLGIAAAARSYGLRGSDEALEAAARAGRRVARCYREEARRAFREHGVAGPAREAFEAAAYRPGTHRLRYDRSQDHALLLAGTNKGTIGRHKYFEDIERLWAFFVDELGYPAPNVREGTARRMTRREHTQAIADASSWLRSRPFANLVIAYSGHGTRAGFFVGENEVPYEEWATGLARREGNTVFVNNTCHAASAAPALRKAGLLPDRLLLLAAARAREYAYGGVFVSDVIAAYGKGSCMRQGERAVNGVDRKGEPVTETQTYCRFGAPFDYLLQVHGKRPSRAEGFADGGALTY